MLLMRRNYQKNGFWVTLEGVWKSGGSAVANGKPATVAKYHAASLLHLLGLAG